MVHENGGADLWTYYWPYYRVLDGGGSVPMGEQTAMGMGFIGAIGVKLAQPDKKVVCVGGDGAMQMAMMELATAAERNCGVWVVDTRTGETVGFLRFDGVVQELFDVQVLPATWPVLVDAGDLTLRAYVLPESALRDVVRP